MLLYHFEGEKFPSLRAFCFFVRARARRSDGGKEIFIPLTTTAKKRKEEVAAKSSVAVTDGQTHNKYTLSESAVKIMKIQQYNTNNI